MLLIESAARSSVGRRANNEDAFCDEPALGLFAVADGMGGYEGGEVASRIVVDTLSEFVRRNVVDGDATWPFAAERARTFCENVALVAVRMANAAVCAQRTGRLASMGSTVAAVLLCGGEAVVAHVGDSRVYRARGGALARLTRDHSLYEEMRALKLPDMPSRADFPHPNVITRAIGMGALVRPDVRTEALAAGDTFLVCSDGVTEALEDDDLAALVASARSAAELADAVVDAALAGGARDNITAVVARVFDGAGDGATAGAGAGHDAARAAASGARPGAP